MTRTLRILLLHLLLLAVGAIAPGPAAAAESPGSALRRLERARGQHETSVAKLRLGVFEAFQAAIQRAVEREDPELAKQLITARGAFEKDGETPTSGEVKTAIDKYERAKARADAKLVAVYQATIQVLDKAGDREGAEQLRAELEEFRQKAGLALTAVVLRGHSDRVNAVAFSPDGKTAASGGSDNTVRLWDLESERTLHVLAGHGAKVRVVVFTPDGRALLSSAYDGTIRVWNSQTGAAEASFDVEADDGNPKNKSRVTALAVARDGRTLAAGTEGGVLWIGDLQKGPVAGKIQLRGDGRNNEICGLRFLADGRRVVLSSGTSLRLVDLRRGREVARMTGPSRLATGIALSADDRFALAGSWDGSVRLWSVRSGRELKEFAGFRECVHDVALSPDGSLAAAAGGGAFEAWNDWQPGRDHTVRIWEVQSGREVLRLDGHTQPVLCVAFSPDGKSLVTGSKDQTVRWWKLPEK